MQPDRQAYSKLPDSNTWDKCEGKEPRVIVNKKKKK